MWMKQRSVVRWAQALSLGALLGVAACSSFQMPESMQGLWGGDSSTGTSSSSSSARVRVPGADARPMSGSEFAGLKARVAEEGMARKKIEQVEEAGRSAYFSAAQIGELVELIDMKNERVRLVETIVERIIDLENPGAITAKLSFADERSSVESLMSDAQVERQKERARLAEEARIAEENRRAEEARQAEAMRIAEEQRQREAEEQARLAQETQTAQNQSSGQSSSQSSSSSNAYCCLNGQYNACDSAGAVAGCMGFGKCVIDCMFGNGKNCEQKCIDENPAVNGCYSEPSNNHLCAK